MDFVYVMIPFSLIIPWLGYLNVCAAFPNHVAVNMPPETAVVFVHSCCEPFKAALGMKI